jgi:hypothetical protein
MIELSRYVFETLREDEEFAFSRGRMNEVLWTSPSLFETAEHHFYSALSRAASCDSAAAEQRQQHLEALTVHHRQLKLWAQNNAPRVHA